MGRREPRGRASALPRRGPHLYFICPAELNSAGIKVLGPRPKTLGRRKAPPRSAGPLRKRPIPSLLTCLIQLFHSQRVLRLGACACPSGPWPAGGPGPFICTGELNSPGIKVLPPAKRLYAPPGAGGSSTR